MQVEVIDEKGGLLVSRERFYLIHVTMQVPDDVDMDPERLLISTFKDIAISVMLSHMHLVIPIVSLPHVTCMGEEDELSVDEVVVRDLVHVIVNVHSCIHTKKGGTGVNKYILESVQRSIWLWRSNSQSWSITINVGSQVHSAFLMT